VRAITILPGTPKSARLEELPHLTGEGAAVLVRALALGVCGTDREIIEGQYGAAPAGRERLVLGHESLGRVEEATPASGFAVGDYVVPMVRHPDPVPCANCAVGEWDMCRNGRYTEHGIKERDGFGVEWFRLHPERLVRVDAALGTLGVLLEPTSIVAKAWEHIERIGHRAKWTPRVVLVTGAGPVGLLAALLGVQRGLDVHVFDRVTSGIKPELVRALGATYHAGDLADLTLDPDVALECTGAPPVIAHLLGHTARNGILCLAGVSAAGKQIPVDLGLLNRLMVLENDVVFGSVNANRRHYEAAATALAAANREWLSRLVTRREPLDRWAAALELHADDVKTVIDFTL
jgi:glucose 1-dehydrogenase